MQTLQCTPAAEPGGAQQVDIIGICFQEQSSMLANGAVVLH